jgi:hypothetical protein
VQNHPHLPKANQQEKKEPVNQVQIQQPQPQQHQNAHQQKEVQKIVTIVINWCWWLFECV